MRTGPQSGPFKRPYGFKTISCTIELSQEIQIMVSRVEMKICAAVPKTVAPAFDIATLIEQCGR
jgi:hypothetical protein